MVLQIKLLPYQEFTTKCSGQRRTHRLQYTQYRNLLEAVVVSCIGKQNSACLQSSDLSVPKVKQNDEIRN